MRVAVTILLAGLVFYGTLWGDDDDFPFGPFRMYSTSRDLDEPVGDTRMYAVNSEGHEFLFTESLSGVRRAEIEGQLERFEEDPTLLRHFAEAYENHFPDRPRVEEVSIVIDWIEIEDGHPTGVRTREEIVAWQR